MARVLVVEDDPLNRIVYELLFADQGHEVRMVGTPDEAIAAVGDWVPDIALLDIHLGAGSGLDVAGHLRGNDATKHIRLVACTAFVDRYTADEVKEAGCDAQVEKIVDFSAFKKQILDEVALAG